MKKRGFVTNILMLLCLLPASLSAGTDSIPSPFNYRSIAPSDPGGYEFIVTGHLHGSSLSRSGFPAASFLANIDTLNSMHPAFMIALGDMFLEVTEENIANYDRSLYRKINYPLYNVVGNHDVNALYKQKFGPTYFAFTQGSEMFIMLDTELDDGSISNEQRKFFDKQLNIAGNSKKIKNVFIFSHRPVWAENNPRYKGLFSDNTRTAIGANNFESEIRPLLIGLARIKNVYWMSGSLGTAPASFFYDKAEDNIVFMQTAIRDLPRDAVLRVQLAGGKVKFSGFSFNGRPLQDITSYNISFWKSNSPAEEKFNYRLLPLMIKQTLLHPYFWWGFLTACLLALAIVLFRRAKLKKRAARLHAKQ